MNMTSLKYPKIMTQDLSPSHVPPPRCLRRSFGPRGYEHPLCHLHTPAPCTKMLTMLAWWWNDDRMHLPSLEKRWQSKAVCTWFDFIYLHLCVQHPCITYARFSLSSAGFKHSEVRGEPRTVNKNNRNSSYLPHLHPKIATFPAFVLLGDGHLIKGRQRCKHRAADPGGEATLRVAGDLHGAWQIRRQRTLQLHPVATGGRVWEREIRGGTSFHPKTKHTFEEILYIFYYILVVFFHHCFAVSQEPSCLLPIC